MSFIASQQNIHFPEGQKVCLLASCSCQLKTQLRLTLAYRELSTDGLADQEMRCSDGLES